MTTPYAVLASQADHADAQDLADVLGQWHDRMVAHVRRHGPHPPADCCDDDACPAAEARSLWLQAHRVFGGHLAQALTFLRDQAGARVS